jgi:hypothetical protein
MLFVVAGCQPCAEVLPYWAALAARAARDGVELVIVSGSGAEETISFLASLGPQIQLPVLVAPTETNPFSRDYQIDGWPSCVVIDAGGQIVSSGYPNVWSGDWAAIADEWHVPLSVSA